MDLADRLLEGDVRALARAISMVEDRAEALPELLSAVRASEDGVQIHGGYGFVKDYPAEKYFRDVKLTTIGEGTSEIQRLVIARQLMTTAAPPSPSATARHG